MKKLPIVGHLIGLIPAVLLLEVLKSYDPLEILTNVTGNWAIYFGIMSLMITPLMKIRFKKLFPLRRLFGLYAAFWALVHLMVWVLFDFSAANLITLPIILGISTLLIWTALAITSFKPGKKLIGKNWRKLHKLAYPAAIMAMIHWSLSVKFTPYLAIGLMVLLAILLATRLNNPFSRK